MCFPSRKPHHGCVCFACFLFKAILPCLARPVPPVFLGAAVLSQATAAPLAPREEPGEVTALEPTLARAAGAAAAAKPQAGQALREAKKPLGRSGCGGVAQGGRRFCCCFVVFCMFWMV